MSQKVVIERVSVKGATPFLGLVDNDDPNSRALYARDAESVMRWLTSAWRTRFNAHRSRRCTYGPDKELVPIGGSVDERTIRQARAEQSYLAAVPDLVLHSAEKLEKQDWFAAARRRKTLIAKGQHPGSMPRFRSFKRDDHTFACWYNGGRNARFTQVSPRHGIVTITGQNPAQWKRPGEKSGRFRIRLHVRTSEVVRDYSSVRVNWTRRELVFVNDPLPIERARTGAVVGIDRGVTHQLATSDGRLWDLPADKLRRIDREIRRRQKAQARAVKVSGHPGQREYRAAGASRRFQDHEARIRDLKAQASRIITDHQHQWTTQLVREHDAIFTERLNLVAMSRTVQAVPDPTRPGKFLRNGQAAKRGLNRVLQGAALGRVQEMLSYKAERAGVILHEVEARNTSRQCAQCGHTAAENRKSQAVFACTGCGHTANADLNAARVIEQRGLAALPGVARAHTYRGGTRPGGEGHQSTGPGSPGMAARPSNREPMGTRLTA